MRRRRFSWFAIVFLIVALIGITDASGSTCTGSEPCTACKNCKYYRHWPQTDSARARAPFRLAHWLGEAHKIPPGRAAGTPDLVSYVRKGNASRPVAPRGARHANSYDPSCPLTKRAAPIAPPLNFQLGVVSLLPELMRSPSQPVAHIEFCAQNMSVGS